MQVSVKYFSVLHSITGKREENLELPEHSTGEIMLEQVLEHYPAIKPYKNILRLAVNQEYRDFSTKLQEQDEVVLITPVSGG